jgi:SAM-dependent methyltransferase
MRASENERRKWDKFYASLLSLEENEAAKEFNEEFRELVSQLLSLGNSILEAGCGAGWQSLALARLGKYNINLMDFSQEALRYAQRLFERENLQATFICEDVFEPNKARHDLVFNAGVLEHYTFDEQVAFLQGMASRSRRYVMVLVPNALCYWYWLWRIQKSGEGKWPFGKEVPVINLSEVFKAAGLKFIGQRFMGEGWTGGLVRSLIGLDERLCQYILDVHASPVIPRSQKSYLVAALGSVTIEKEESPLGWEKISQLEENGVAEIRAALADALALRINAEQKLRVLQPGAAKRTELTHQLQTMKAELAKERKMVQAVRSSFSFQLGSVLVEAFRRPGRNTILLPYYLVRLCIMILKKRKKDAFYTL